MFRSKQKFNIVGSIFAIMFFCLFQLSVCDSAPAGDFLVITRLCKSAELKVGKKCFDISVKIQGFGIISLDRKVYAGWPTFSDLDKEGASQNSVNKPESCQYDRGEAIYGIDTETINVMVDGDKAWIDWETIPQGSAACYDHSFRVYQKGQTVPLIARDINAHFGCGRDESESQELTVKEFSRNILELQIDCRAYRVWDVRVTPLSWEEKKQRHMTNIQLRQKVKFRFLSNGEVEVEKVGVFCKKRKGTSLAEIKQYFPTRKSDTFDNEGYIEIFPKDKSSIVENAKYGYSLLKLIEPEEIVKE